MSREVHQIESFKTAKLGETVVMKCSTKSIWSSRVWYKLGTNRSLQLLASTANVFEKRVLNRYSIQTSPNETIFTIMHMTAEDVGTYYCGILSSFNVSFGSGTVLELEGESKPMQSVLQSPDYIKVQPGDSVTLNCSFNTNHCSQDHTSVTWVKSSASEMISWNDINEIVCDLKNTEESGCVHNMTLSNITSSADGTYLCFLTFSLFISEKRHLSCRHSVFQSLNF
uniref:Ig-like domain-containing protein n=1 Tax=Periophthalmus magnuspinnatus TaxID=409849 RepID=A0A3B4B4D9_9GOBI